ncbi:MAG: hypothetical protein JWN75_406 [Candidatus Saccharibacteria bacterium]|nr:hypothetical protein [Candidatus Saccharibacteria bacterium]
MSGFSGAVVLGLMRTDEEEAEEQSAKALSHNDEPDWCAHLQGLFI